MTPPAPTQFPRHIAVLILLCMGCAFAGNHIAARVAFDDGAGVLLAILMRSGGTLLVLAILVLYQRQNLRLPQAPGAGKSFWACSSPPKASASTPPSPASR